MPYTQLGRFSYFSLSCNFHRSLNLLVVCLTIGGNYLGGNKKGNARVALEDKSIGKYYVSNYVIIL